MVVTAGLGKRQGKRGCSGPRPFFFFYLFTYLFDFWLQWVLAAARRLSLVAVRGLLIAVAALVEDGAQAQWLWGTGLVAPWRVGSSQTRDGTHVHCISSQILSHWTTRGVPQSLS